MGSRLSEKAFSLETGLWKSCGQLRPAVETEIDLGILLGAFDRQHRSQIHWHAWGKLRAFRVGYSNPFTATTTRKSSIALENPRFLRLISLAEHLFDFSISTAQGFHRNVTSVVLTNMPEREFRKVEPGRWLRRDWKGRTGFV